MTLSLLGEHHAHNAAAVTAAALAAGVGFATSRASLRAITALSKWRMQLLERPDGLRVINDAYNANPDSVRAALTTLAGIGRRTGSRTVAVLGEMRELGDAASRSTAPSGASWASSGSTSSSWSAPSAAEIGEAAKAWVSPLQAGDVREAVDLVARDCPAPDVVLVKASRRRGTRAGRRGPAGVRRPRGGRT